MFAQLKFSAGGRVLRPPVHSSPRDYFSPPMPLSCGTSVAVRTPHAPSWPSTCGDAKQLCWSTTQPMWRCVRAICVCMAYAYDANYAHLSSLWLGTVHARLSIVSDGEEVLFFSSFVSCMLCNVHICSPPFCAAVLLR